MRNFRHAFTALPHDRFGSRVAWPVFLTNRDLMPLSYSLLARLGAGAALLTLAACSVDHLGETTPEVSPESLTLTHAEVVDLIRDRMVDGDVFDWTALDDAELYAAGVTGDSLFTLGYWYGEDKARAPELIGVVDVDTGAWRRHFDGILAEVLALESASLGRAVTRADVLVFGEPAAVPQATLRLSAPASIAFLRQHPDTRYVEPMGFDPEAGQLAERSSSGCDGGDPNYGLPSADYVVTSPNVKAPWNFGLHNVQAAWAHSQGAGVGVEVIDTGSSDDQDNLGSQFASGLSAGRSITRLSTHYSGSWWWRSLDPPHDPCGHGTRMSGLATAPRGSDGNSVGVAYRANLTTVRAVADVVITSSNESNGVKNALIIAGNDPGTRIVSMSIGTPFSNGTVRDGIYYAYNRGKLLVAAAGTSFSWTSWYGVIFPANLSQTVAVTGIREGMPFQRCSNCHDGPEVDFVIHMQRRNDDDRTTVSLANYSNQPRYSGGSSCATATTAGIAALVWAKYPGWSRSQVISRLAQSSSYYPSRDGDFGWGAIDALQAVTNPI